MAFLLAVLASALILWLIAKNKNKGRGQKQTRNHGALTTNGATIGYTKSNLTNESEIRKELDLANKAVGGLTDIQRAWCETFLRCKQVMEESFAIAEKTKDEITRSSRLEVARNNLERLESLSQSADCPLELHNSEEIWAEYYRLSGSESPSTWGEDKPVDLSYFIGRPWGEIVAEMTGGANLVDGKQTWELAEEHKHDLPKMLECCQAELRTMEQAGQVPAPFYFERAAILLRKAKEYESEVKLIELYLSAIDAWNSINGQARPMGGGARHEKILQRYEKAKQLATKDNRLKDG
jgi:hypothetical protein